MYYAIGILVLLGFIALLAALAGLAVVFGRLSEGFFYLMARIHSDLQEEAETQKIVAAAPGRGVR